MPWSCCTRPTLIPSTTFRPCASALQSRRGPLCSFVGNEVNLPGSPIAEKIAFLGEVGAEHIFTQLPLEAGRWLYSECQSAAVSEVPHALAESVFRVRTPPEQRPVDIGVRSARYTPYLGDDDRNRLLDRFALHRFEPPLCVDIDTRERLAHDEWAMFLDRARGTLATEAGSFYLERDDATVNAIRRHVLSAQDGIVIPADSRLRTLGHRLPWWLRAGLRRMLGHGPLRHEAVVNEQLDHNAIYQRFFRNRPRAPVYSKAISSRHFDAIGTKTCQIMFPGRFNGILEADRHYLALAPDFSNLDDVLERFRDPRLRQAIVEEAYAHVTASHTHHHRVRAVYDVLAPPPDPLLPVSMAAANCASGLDSHALSYPLQ